MGKVPIPIHDACIIHALREFKKKAPIIKTATCTDYKSAQTVFKF